MSHFLPAVSVAEFREIIKRQMKHGINRPVFGLGKGGIGKTESIAQLCLEELHIGYKDIRLLLYSESDLKGIPYVNQAHTHSIWLQNDILPRAERDGEQGILVLDEVTSCSKSVRTAAYQLLNERCLGEYQLPPGWQVVCLGNGEEDGGQFTGMEGNFANRCTVFQVVAEIESWKSWALEEKVHPYVLAYLSWCPQHLHSYDPEKEEFVFASPRSWKAVSDLLHLFPLDEKDPLTTAQIYGNIGTAVGRSFLAFCKMRGNIPQAQEILQNNAPCFSPSQEGLLLLLQGVIFLMKEELSQETGHIFSETLVNHWVNGVNWMLSLNKVEHQMLAIKDLVTGEKSARLLASEAFTSSCPALLDFAQEHREILCYSGLN